MKMKMSNFSSYNYQKISDFLKYLIDSKEDQINKQELGLDGFEIAQKLGCDEKETNDIMEIFAEFYLFFKVFFLGDPTNKINKENDINGSNILNNQNNGSCKEIEITNKNTGLLCDFALLFKQMPESDLKEKFPDLFRLLYSHPELFQKYVKLSEPALKFTENIRKFKTIGKIKKEMKVGNYKFKITDF